MTEAKLKIVINRSPADVFSYVLDPARSPDWIDSFAYEETNELPPRLGTIYRNRNQAGEWSEYRLEVFEPPRHFVLSSVGGSFHVAYTLTLQPGGATLLEYHEWVDDGSLDEPFGMAPFIKLKGLLEQP